MYVIISHCIEANALYLILVVSIYIILHIPEAYPCMQDFKLFLY